MIEEIGTIEDVFEEIEMLTQHKETWFDDAIEKGFLQGQEKGREEGREEGREAALMSVARNMLERGASVEEIVQVTGLQAKAVQSLLH
jgi:predicted transposase/invertase (TIGR01784 family)